MNEQLSQTDMSSEFTCSISSLCRWGGRPWAMQFGSRIIFQRSHALYSITKMHHNRSCSVSSTFLEKITRANFIALSRPETAAKRTRFPIVSKCLNARIQCRRQTAECTLSSRKSRVHLRICLSVCLSADYRYTHYQYSCIRTNGTVRQRMNSRTNCGRLGASSSSTPLQRLRSEHPSTHSLCTFSRTYGNAESVA